MVGWSKHYIPFARPTDRGFICFAMWWREKSLEPDRLVWFVVGVVSVSATDTPKCICVKDTEGRSWCYRADYTVERSERRRCTGNVTSML